jgi:hypothetical protein
MQSVKLHIRRAFKIHQQHRASQSSGVKDQNIAINSWMCVKFNWKTIKCEHKTATQRHLN